MSEVLVFMNEYGFRVEPGFVPAERGERVEFRNVTPFKVDLEFTPELYRGKISLKPGEAGGFKVPDKLKRGFHSYRAMVEIVRGQHLDVLGGSAPGVIIRP